MNNGTVTLTWSATEGGTYMVQSTTDFSTWTTNSTSVAAVLKAASYTNNPTDNHRFYRVARTALVAYDGSGGGTASFVAPGGSVSRGNGKNITVSITLSTGGANPPMLPPANAPITSLTLGGIAGTGVSAALQGTVVATFAIAGNTATGAKDVVVTFGVPPGQSVAPTFTLAGGFTINP